MSGFIVACYYLNEQRTLIDSIKRIDKLRTVISLDAFGHNAVTVQMTQNPIGEDGGRMTGMLIGQRNKECSGADVSGRVQVQRQSWSDCLKPEP